MKIIAAILLFTWMGSFAHGQQMAEKKGTLVVKISGLRSNDGRMKVLLFHSKDGFPNHPQQAFQVTDLDSLRDHECQVTFTDLERGEYAIGTLHDENANDRMDTGLFGIPKEGFGASNDAKSLLGPPKYKEAKFSLDSDTLHLEIRMNY